MNDFYFGCIRQSGHYLFTPDLRSVYHRSVNFPKDFPIRIEYLDTGLLGYSNPAGPEGHVVLSHIGKWTIISFWDRSVDNRAACNSNFIMRGTLTAEEAVAHAREVWPLIFVRFKFDIVIPK